VYFVTYYRPWFARGGHHQAGTEAGIFNFDANPGEASSGMAYRIVLMP